ncbi:MAG: phycobilisome linker polypeptide [Hormoscilla sp.]
MMLRIQTVGMTGVSSYDNRSVVIEVTGMCCNEISKTSNYKIKVPYSSMSQVMQNIMGMGGKVKNVSVEEASLSPSSPAAEE